MNKRQRVHFLFYGLLIVGMTFSNLPYSNETPTVNGLAAEKNYKLYTETMIFLWNNHYNLNFNV